LTSYLNASDERRTWTRITRPDGRTLELAPGEEAELDLAEDFSDPFLRPAPARVEAPEPAPKAFSAPKASRVTPEVTAPPADSPEAAAEATEPKE